MAVHLQHIVIKQAGPLTDLNLDLGLVNLIYGSNEKGKTYLVEFILRSLFKQMRQWRLRRDAGQGRVMVAGLEESNPVEMSPASGVKLDEFIEQINPGLPLDISRLLVVKGAQSELSGDGSESDRSILRRFLSGREVLDAVAKNIPASIQKAANEKDLLQGPDQGKYKDLKKVRGDLEKIESLFEEVDRDFSEAQIGRLTGSKNELQKKRQAMEEAKRHYAWSLSNELQDLERSLKQVPAGQFTEIRASLEIIESKKEGIREKSEQAEKVRTHAVHYEWLRSARKNYLEARERAGKPPFLILLIFGLLGLAAVPVFIALSMVLPAYIAVGCSIIGIGLYVLQGFLFRRKGHWNEEVEVIAEEFRLKFDRNMTSVADIDEMINILREHQVHARVLDKDIEDENKALDELSAKISVGLQNIYNQKIEPANWRRAFQQAEKRMTDLREKQIKLQEKLELLHVPPDEYRPEPGPVEYDAVKSREYEKETNELAISLEKEEERRRSLKQRLCDATRDSIDQPWETVIRNLHDKKSEFVDQIQQLAGEIIGKRLVFDIVQELRSDEDAKILEGLKSKSVIRPLKEITGHYSKLGLMEDELLVSDAFQDFPISELSTGTREQVLLALRIGFSEMLFKRENLFLILDDAFQYSDYRRRERLVESMAGLAGRGWQILYFTMDDHLRVLFGKKMKSFGEQYREFDLDSISGGRGQEKLALI